MKNKWVGLAFLAAGAVLAQDQGPARTEVPASLVRRDLVRSSPPAFPPLKRDLFSLQSALPGAAGGLDLGPGYVTAPPEKVEPEVPSRPAFALRYVGFIQNRARMKVVGLVMFEGQFLSVEAGDAVGPGWKVRRVTDKEVEVEGPDGASLVFALEGEIR
jgi:hypothetical protein